MNADILGNNQYIDIRTSILCEGSCVQEKKTLLLLISLPAEFTTRTLVLAKDTNNTELTQNELQKKPPH